MNSRIHIVGAGLSGLSAAVRLTAAGFNVSLYEASRFAGGRCRSFFDGTLQATIDNGAHLMLSGNTDIADYMELIGSSNEAYTMDRAAFNFLDVKSDQSWSVDLGAGRGRLSLLPWLFDAKRRPPNVTPMKLVQEMWALKNGHGKTVHSCLDPQQKHFKSFWEPLCVGVMNAYPGEASAELLWNVLKETVMLGGAATKPMLTRNGLGLALIDPALERLKHLNAKINFNARVQNVEHKKGRIAGLNLAHGVEVLGLKDSVILAVPHYAIDDLGLGIPSPKGSHAILNVHYLLERPVKTELKGLINSPVQWVFCRDNVASVTISAADNWVNKNGVEIAQLLWPDVSKALGIKGDELPKFRVIKEKRATFSQTPDNLVHRAKIKTKFENLFMAGDWTDTKLPATIEGSIRSGRKTAETVIENLNL